MQKKIKTNEQVIITDKGVLTTVIPLFIINESFELTKMDGYEVVCMKNDCVGYAMIIDDEGHTAMINKNIVEQHSIFLGDL